MYDRVKAATGSTNDFTHSKGKIQKACTVTTSQVVPAGKENAIGFNKTIVGKRNRSCQVLNRSFRNIRENRACWMR